MCARYFATASADKTVKLWNVKDWSLAQRLVGHQKWVWDCVFSADSSYLVSASSDNSARLWELASGEQLRMYNDHHKPVVCVALNDSSVSPSTTSSARVAQAGAVANGVGLPAKSRHSSRAARHDVVDGGAPAAPAGAGGAVDESKGAEEAGRDTA